MRSSVWSDLYWGVLTSKAWVEGVEEPFVFSAKNFPMLKQLEGFSNLEVLVLADLICRIESLNSEATSDKLVEVLSEGGFPEIEVEAALHKNVRCGYVKKHLGKDNNFLYSANRDLLEAKGLFEYNEWYRLRVDLYLLFELCDN